MARALADKGVIVAVPLPAQLDFLIVVLPVSAPRFVEKNGVSKEGDDQHADGRDKKDCRREEHVVHQPNLDAVPLCTRGEARAPIA